jgi:hypothetical protein
MMRLIKGGIIQTAKLGRQHRIMGKELLRAISPRLEDKVGQLYNKGRRWLHEEGEFVPNPKPEFSSPRVEERGSKADGSNKGRRRIPAARPSEEPQLE